MNIDDILDADCKGCFESRTGVCTHHLAANIADIDQLWHVIDLWVTRNSDGATRDKMRRLLHRRLLHPEATGLGSNPHDVVTKRKPGPRQWNIPSPKCVCEVNDFEHPHDEMTGACRVCECERFEPIPETAGYRHQTTISGDTLTWMDLL